MADLKNPTKKNITDAIFEALTSKVTLEEIIKRENYEPFKINKSQIKFLVHNLDMIAQDRLADLTDEGLQKIRKKLGKRFTDLVTIEDAQAVIGRVTEEYQKLSGKVGETIKKRGRPAKKK